jgi:hypothetical protein
MKVYPKVGKCIYCGATTYRDDLPGPPHAEHIIPEGLGGDLLLPEASCQQCEAATSTFEGMCLRRQFGPLRIYMGLPSKRMKDRPTTLPVVANFTNEPNRMIEVPIEEHPRMIAVYFMDVPALFGPASDGYRKIRITLLPDSDGATADTFAANKAALDTKCAAIAAKHGACGIQTIFATVVNELQLMLAKIAHSFAVAELGSESFFPFLPDLIRSKSTSNIRMFVGFASEGEGRSQTELHRLSLHVRNRGRLFLLVCIVSLFRNIDLIQYQVVVGRFYEEPPDICITRQILN